MIVMKKEILGYYMQTIGVFLKGKNKTFLMVMVLTTKCHHVNLCMKQKRLFSFYSLFFENKLTHVHLLTMPKDNFETF